MAPLDPALQWLLRAFLAFVLMRAAWHKGRDLAAFRLALAGYQLIPSVLVQAASLALVALEATSAVALLVPATSAAGAWGAGGLLVLYSAAIAINLLRGRRAIDCGCSGPAGGRPLGEALLVRNGLLIGAVIACSAPAAARSVGAVDALTVFLGAAVASLLYTAVDLALDLAPRMRSLRHGT